MGVYRLSSVSVESYVEMAPEVTVCCEVDRPSNNATLFFGAYSDFVLMLDRGALEQVVQLGTRAMAELDREPAAP